MAAALKEHLYAVILAGGGGTRLWPRSTEAKPKQFLRLVSDRTMIQETYRRIVPLVAPERIAVVTNRRYRAMVWENLPELPRANVLCEPQKRDTAMAMGLGAVWAQKRDRRAVIINLAADHVVSDGRRFRKTVFTAAAAAKTGDYLLTVGIHPAFPHTGYGYIRVKKLLKDKRFSGERIFSVAGFTEKPSFSRAKSFIAAGKYFWNANMYVWTAESALKSFQKFLPKIYRRLVKIRAALGTAGEKKELERAYRTIEPISIDYGISEKAENLLLVPGDFGWNDVGDWQVVYDLSKKNASKNVVDRSRKHPPILLDSQGCFICGGRKLLAVVGLEEMVMVETRKAQLIIPLSKAQDVKRLVSLLREKGMGEYL